MKLGFTSIIPNPLFPQLGPKGRLYVTIGTVGAFMTVSHAHKYDWVWVAVGLINVALPVWRACVGMPETPNSPAAQLP